MLAACAAVLLFVYVRLYLYPDRLVPLAYALPLLLGLWHKNRGIHAAKTIAFCVIAGIQVFMLVAEEHQAVSPPAAMAMIAVNILTIGVVVDRLIVAQRRLYESMESLEQSNENLEAANAELVAREEEIAAQNEELQTQSDELEQHNEELQQQSEELQQQAEELQQQAGEMQVLNDEAPGRPRGPRRRLRPRARSGLGSSPSTSPGSGCACSTSWSSWCSPAGA